MSLSRCAITLCPVRIAASSSVILVITAGILIFILFPIVSG
jgi:hypothetical protein